MINHSDLMDLLKNYKIKHESDFGIEQLGVFGSYARNQATEESDVDVVIKTRRPNLFRLSKIRIELESLLHKHVDLVCYRTKMNPYLKSRIDKEAIYI